MSKGKRRKPHKKADQQQELLIDWIVAIAKLTASIAAIIAALKS